MSYQRIKFDRFLREDKKFARILKNIDPERIAWKITSLVSHGSLHLHNFFEERRESLKKNIKHEISYNDTVEMITQHILIKPLFSDLFPHVSKMGIYEDLEEFCKLIGQEEIKRLTRKLNPFYDYFKEKLDSNRYNFSDRQEFIKKFFETLYLKFFPKKAQNLGIVYTPIECVDFILYSVQHMLKKHFKTSLGDQKVEILDPFTGVGTFITQLITSGLLNNKDLKRKFKQEIQAYEIVPFSYYVAAMNIEEAFSLKTNERRPFLNIELVDTFTK